MKKNIEKIEKNREEQKHHYWRGFMASLVITIPIIIFLTVMLNKLININL